MCPMGSPNRANHVDQPVSRPLVRVVGELQSLHAALGLAGCQDFRWPVLHILFFFGAPTNPEPF